ncbi:hypothetical protein HN709_04245, partial [Candidatus Peregrinibacteria bacterium]|nr:hypothetical protein [Candidatus Peregrinibacteria bacterium]
MADGKGKSGRPINPFEEMSMSNEKKVDKTKKDPKKEKWDKIEKGVSESKRGDLKSAIKEDVKTNASKKRRRPRRRNKISEAKPIDNKNIIEQKEKVVQPVEQVDKQQVDKQQVDNQQAAPVNPFGEMAQQAPPAQEQRPPIQEQKPVEPVKKKVAVDSPVVPETPPEPDPFTN